MNLLIYASLFDQPCDVLECLFGTYESLLNRLLLARRQEPRLLAPQRPRGFELMGDLVDGRK